MLQQQQCLLQLEIGLGRRIDACRESTQVQTQDPQQAPCAPPEAFHDAVSCWCSAACSMQHAGHIPSWLNLYGYIYSNS